MLAIAVEMRGWAQVSGSLKYHYFNGDGTASMCGRWVPDNLAPSQFYDGDHGSSDNCAACKINRKKQQLRDNG